MPDPCKKFVVRPQLLESGKASEMLTRSSCMSCSVLVVASGGENNLHSHPKVDEVFYVVGGQATFYGEGDELLATVGPNEGMFVPRGAPYWFESSSPDNLVLVRFAASIDGGSKDERIDIGEKKWDLANRPKKLREGEFFGAAVS
jgi:mannose-6-phosphate isomerase-like protein (cupin superfamily)